MTDRLCVCPASCLAADGAWWALRVPARWARPDSPPPRATALTVLSPLPVGTHEGSQRLGGLPGDTGHAGLSRGGH